MLLQVEVENFRSIREPVVFSVLAADHVDHPEGSAPRSEGPRRPRRPGWTGGGLRWRRRQLGSCEVALVYMLRRY